MSVRLAAPLFPLLLVLSSVLSCGAPGYLVTDPSFRAAAPEVVTQWVSLRPFRNAQTIDLATSDQGALSQALDALPKDARILVGVAMGSSQREALGTRDRRLVFLSSPTPGVRTAGVRRGQAWALVAEGALSFGNGPAWVIFPPNATPEERRQFSDAWARSGRGLVEGPGGQTGNQALDTLFIWAEEPVNPLPPLPVPRWVHGNPGLSSPPDSRGYTWKISPRGLGEVLWEALENPLQEVTFLPLETTLTSR